MVDVVGSLDQSNQVVERIPNMKRLSEVDTAQKKVRVAMFESITLNTWGEELKVIPYNWVFPEVALHGSIIIYHMGL